MEQYQYLSTIYDKSMELSGIDYDKWFGKIQDLLGNDKKNKFIISATAELSNMYIFSPCKLFFKKLSLK